MPVQFNPAAAQAQNAVLNPFVQRGEDQTHGTTARDEDRNRDQVRAQSASAAESQRTDTRNRENVRANDRDDDNTQRRTQQRGSTVDIVV